MSRAEQDWQDARSERPAMGRGQPRTLDAPAATETPAREKARRETVAFECPVADSKAR